MSEEKDIDWDKVLEYYDQGLTDRKIGKKFKCGYRPIFEWRHANNLPANHKGRGKVDNSIIKAALIGVGVGLIGYKAYKGYKRKKENKKE